MNFLDDETTFTIDGLLEGPTPPLPGLREEMEAWRNAAEEAGYPFRLRFDGRRYSLLATKKSIVPADGRPASGQELERLLNDLVARIPDGERRRAMSTLRSVEDRGSDVVETVYAVVPNGNIASDQRVRLATAKPDESKTNPTRRLLLIGGLVLGAVLVGFLAGGWSNLVQWWKAANLEIADVERATLDLNRFLDYRITAVSTEGVDVIIEPKSDCPTKPADYEALRERLLNENDAASWASLEAAFRGVVTVEIQTDDGAILFADRVTFPPAWSVTPRKSQRLSFRRIGVPARVLVKP